MPRHLPSRPLAPAIARWSATASATWKIDESDGVKTITLRTDGVRRASLYRREPWFTRGEAIAIRIGERTVFEGALEPDRRVLLEEARRTGDRQRPILRRVEVGS